MRERLNRLLWCGALFLLCSCTKKSPNKITIEEMIHSHGLPTVIASDYKIDRDVPLLTVTLYGVNKRVTTETVNHFSPGQIVVFCTDPRFIREVGFHFDNMRDPYQFSGSTMFAALLRDDTKLTIFQITENSQTELKYSGYAMVVYLEVGDKDHLIRVKPLRPKPSTGSNH